MEEFGELEIYSQYGSSWPSLNELRLKDGEMIEVLWPDGTISEHEVSTHTEHYRGFVDVCGAKIFVMVRGHMLGAELYRSGLKIRRKEETK